MKKAAYPAVAALLLVISACATTDTADSPFAAAGAPRYRVDASWPKAHIYTAEVGAGRRVQKFVRVAD